MKDADLVFRLRSAIGSGAAQAAKRPEYADADADAKWLMIAEGTVANLSTEHRAVLGEAFDKGRIPGFREMNDIVWKATGGQVVTLEVDSVTGVVQKVYLQLQADRDVE